MTSPSGKFTATIISGDYTTVRAWVEVPVGEPYAGRVKLDRVRAVLAGNAVASEIGVYQRPSGESVLPSDLVLAQSEEFVDDAVPAIATPAPDLNIHSDPPQVIEFAAGNSLYVTYLAGPADAAVSGTVELWLAREG